MINKRIVLPSHPTHHSQDIKDLLGYESYANAIYTQICNMKPYNNGITFGITGEWGMGKSTVLNMLEKKLDSDKRKFIAVRFDAWRYLRQEDLWLALFRKIIQELPKHIWFAQIKYWYQRVKNNPKMQDVFLSYTIKFLAVFSLIMLSLVAWKFLAPLDWLAFFDDLELKFGLITGKIKDNTILNISLLLFLVVYILKLMFFGNLETNLPPLTKNEFDHGQSIMIDDFNYDFVAMLKSLGEKKTVVFLIDDLDRCPPDQIVPVLEAIKNLASDKKHLGSAKTVFVLAVDPNAIEHALTGYFKDYFPSNDKSEEARQFAKNYIEKIIQVPIFLPPINESKLSDMLEYFLVQKGNDP